MHKNLQCRVLSPRSENPCWNCATRSAPRCLASFYFSQFGRLVLSLICADSAQHVVHLSSRNVLTLSLFWVSKSPLILTCSQSESRCRICTTRSALQFLACFSILSPRSVLSFPANTNLSRNCLSSQSRVSADLQQKSLLLKFTWSWSVSSWFLKGLYFLFQWSLSLFGQFERVPPLDSLLFVPRFQSWVCCTTGTGPCHQTIWNLKTVTVF